MDTVFTSPTYANATHRPTNNEMSWQEVYWYNPVNIGDTFQITLADGQTVIREGRCENANQSQVFRMWGIRVRDFIVPTLTSGKIYIYYK